MDELRRDALSCYGAQAIQTPHLDRLAASGCRFNRAYTPSPLCLPARCSIATGLYPHRSRAYSNDPGRDTRLNPALPNLYTLFGAAGYTTAHIGKCHYAPVPYGRTRPGVTLPYDEFREFYLSLGMDHLDLQDDKQVSVWFRDDYAAELDAAGHLAAYRDAVWNRDFRKVFPFPGPAEWHPDSWVGRKSVDYLDTCDTSAPLLLWVSFSGPHYPFDPPESFLSRVDPTGVGAGRFRDGEFDRPTRLHHRAFNGSGPGSAIDGCGPAPGHACRNYDDDYWRRLRHYYFANVAQMDDEIGRILAAAQRRLGDDVLVLFSCDHGEMLGNHRLWGKNRCAYEDVLNVPLLARFPGQTTPRTSDALVSLVDLLPTALAVAGIHAPDLDGRDLRASIEDGGHGHVLAESELFVTVTDGRLKYVHARVGDAMFAELYDLGRDPDEYTSFIDEPEHARGLANLRGAALDVFLNHALP